MASVDEDFTYLRIPADASDPLEELKAEGGWAGDQIPELVKPRFAGGKLDDRAVAEAAHKSLGDAGARLNGDAFRSAVAEGSVETFPLVHPSESNSYEGVYAYLDECGLLKSLPPNPRATALAGACGMSDAKFHGDVFVGRVRIKPSPARNMSFTITDMASDAEWLRRAPAENADYHMELRRVQEAAERKAPGQGAEPEGVDTCRDSDGRSLVWTQTEDELELHVAVPAGTRARALTVSFAGGGLKVTAAGQEAPLVRAAKLYEPIRPDQSTWTVTDMKGAHETGRELVLTLDKVRSAHWPSLCEA